MRRWARASSATASTSAERDRRPALVRGEGRGRLVDRQVGAEAVGPFSGATGAERVEHRLGHDHRGQAAAVPRRSARLRDGRPRPSWRRKPAGSASKASRRRTTSARERGSVIGSTSTARPNRSSNCGRRSPSSGFIVPTRTNRDGWRNVESLALDVVDAHRGGVEQEVDQVVAEQVDLVDVEDAAVRRGQQAGLERSGAGREGPLEVQGCRPRGRPWRRRAGSRAPPVAR